MKQESNIPGMFRRTLKLARLVGTAEDKKMAAAYEVELEAMIERVEGQEAEMLAVNFAAASTQEGGGK